MNKVFLGITAFSALISSTAGFAKSEKQKEFVIGLVCPYAFEK